MLRAESTKISDGYGWILVILHGICFLMYTVNHNMSPGGYRINGRICLSVGLNRNAMLLQWPCMPFIFIAPVPILIE